MNILMGIMRMFMSAKIAGRISNTDISGLRAGVGGPELLPEGFIDGTRPYTARYGF